MSQADINARANLALLGFQVLSYLLLLHRLRRIERRQVADGRCVQHGASP